MAKQRSVYVCQQCGQDYPRWEGQCGNCGSWNTLVEEVKTEARSAGIGRVADAARIMNFSEVNKQSGPALRRSTGIAEFDRVLGGNGDNKGMVAGAVMLIGGEPGVGKSTLLTQMAIEMLAQLPNSKKTNKKITQNSSSKSVMYVAGEESPSQISLRINRILEKEQKNINKKKLSKKSVSLDNLKFVSTTNVDAVVVSIAQEKPSVVIVDSIQTMTTEDLRGAAGSVGQVRESAERLTQIAKQLNIPMFLVGHVTKEGQLAGPKVLEHIVDSVLELTGERTSELRILRAIKNRFGATDEVGVFQLTEFGFDSVTNPTELFLEHADKSVPGSVTVCVMEGTRPLLVEIQALAVRSQLAMPRRVGRGVELSKIQIISAVLQKYSRIPLSSYDLFVSVAGGYVAKEPSIDLGIAVAIASSMAGKALPAKSVCIGEVGLLGEVRSVSFLERRVKEAKRLGFSNVIAKPKVKRVDDLIKKYQLS